MVNTTANLDGILPDPILHVFRPGRLELLLADGAGVITEGGIVRSADPCLWRALLGGIAFCTGASFGGGICVGDGLVVVDLAGFNPIL
jgi:hypothetical protein